MSNRIKSLFGSQDLTVGNPVKCLLLFSVPLLIGNIAQLLYSTIDSIVVGRHVGDAALSALGITTPIVTLFIVVFIALGSGIMVMVSQYFGAKDFKSLEHTIGNAITLIAIASVLLTVVGVVFAGSILKLIDTPVEAFDMAKTYLVIIMLGSAGDGFYNIFSNIIRGIGDSIFPLIVLLLTTVLNIVLDLLFVVVFKMGVAGAAWATTICKTLSAVACVLKVLLARQRFTIHLSDCKLKAPIVRNICRIGIPSGLAQAAMYLTIIFIQSFINKMGYLVTASITTVIRVDSFAVLPSQALGMSATTYTGQNVGAGKLDRVKEGSKKVLMLSLCITFVMVVAVLLLGKQMMHLFTSTPEVINMAYGFIKIMIPGYFFMTVSETFGGVIRGAGDSLPPMWFNIISQVVIRIPLEILLIRMTTSPEFPAGNPNVNWITLVIILFIHAVATFIYYLSGKWKTKSIIERKD